jgi:hypothetical protein
MRKAALLAAVIMAAAFSMSSNTSFAQATTDQNPNTTKLMGDAMNPYGATSQPAAKPKMAKHSKKKAKTKAM